MQPGVIFLLAFLLMLPRAVAQTPTVEETVSVPLESGPESQGGLDPVAPPQAPSMETKKYTPNSIAVLQGLDKITARVSRFEAVVDQVVRFGTLRLSVRSCQNTVDEEVPDSAAFIEIDEQKPSYENIRRFTGWMFASSPALSALEHPVYDVWLLTCTNPDTAPSGNAPR
jgi:hypothetical protein